jgi:hypothetical protein
MFEFAEVFARAATFTSGFLRGTHTDYHFRAHSAAPVPEQPTARAAISPGARPLRRRTTSIAAGLLLVVLVTSPAHAGEDESSLARFSWGVGAGLCTLVYTPLKVAYAATAIPLGGLVWLWSVGDTDVTRRVVLRATGGDYVVTPEHLKRERTLVFFADSDAPEREAANGETTRES